MEHWLCPSKFERCIQKSYSRFRRSYRWRELLRIVPMCDIKYLKIILRARYQKDRHISSKFEFLLDGCQGLHSPSPQMKVELVHPFYIVQILTTLLMCNNGSNSIFFSIWKWPPILITFHLRVLSDNKNDKVYHTVCLWARENNA